MSLWDSIKGAFAAKPAGEVARDSNLVYIVDADTVYEGRGNPGPAERAGLLNRLAAFGQREKIQLRVVMGGRPLREAAHGDELNGVHVYYAEQGGGMAEQVGQLAQRAGRCIVITSDKAVEAKVAGTGAQLMKGSTLRKALEGEGSGGGDEQGGGRGDRRDRGDRSDRRDRGGRGERRDRGDRGDRGDRPPREPREPREQREQRPEQQPATETGAGAETMSADSTSDGTDDGLRRGPQPTGPVTVKSLIDLVE